MAYKPVHVCREKLEMGEVYFTVWAMWALAIRLEDLCLCFYVFVIQMAASSWHIMYHNFLRIQFFDDFQVVTYVPLLSVPMHPLGNRNGGMPLAINWRWENSICLRPVPL